MLPPSLQVVDLTLHYVGVNLRVMLKDLATNIATHEEGLPEYAYISSLHTLVLILYELTRHGRIGLLSSHCSSHGCKLFEMSMFISAPSTEKSGVS